MNKKDVIFLVVLVIVLIGGALAWQFWPEKVETPAPAAETPGESVARQAIQEAEKAKQGIIDEASEIGVTFPPEIFTGFDMFLAQAKSALAAGNYQEAQLFTKQAKITLGILKDSLEILRGVEIPSLVDEAPAPAAETPGEFAAHKVIQEAEKAKQGIIDEAAEIGVTFPPGIFIVFDMAFAQAKSALAAGNYQEAQRFAKQAKVALEIPKDALEILRGIKR